MIIKLELEPIQNNKKEYKEEEEKKEELQARNKIIFLHLIYLIEILYVFIIIIIKISIINNYKLKTRRRVIKTTTIKKRINEKEMNEMKD